MIQMRNKVRKKHSKDREKEKMLQPLRRQNPLNQKEDFRLAPVFLSWITG